MNREDEIRGLHRSLRDGEEDARFLAVAAALGVALLALTATSWLTRVTGSTRGVTPSTAWDLPRAAGFPGAVVLVLVLGTAVAGLVTGASVRPNARVHRILAAAAAVTAALGILVVVVLDDEYRTAPGLWMGLLATVGLAVVHAARAAAVRRRDG